MVSQTQIFDGCLRLFQSHMHQFLNEAISN
jgi:hypothetical protein